MVFGRSVNRTSAPAPPMTYRITLERNTLRFAAAHFTTFGGECEPIHGHNYDVFVEIEGDLTSDSWVLDFSEAKSMIAAICKELDHRFLLPTKGAALSIAERGAEYEIKFGDRRYVLPKSDVALLPIDNSTAERLAVAERAHPCGAFRLRGVQDYAHHRWCGRGAGAGRLVRQRRRGRLTFLGKTLHIHFLPISVAIARLCDICFARNT